MGVLWHLVALSKQKCGGALPQHVHVWVATEATCTRTCFQKDPFQFEKIRFGVSTRIVRVNPETPFTRTWIDPPTAETCLHLKSTASVYGLVSSSNHTFLFVSIACQCRSSVWLYVLVPRARSVRSLRIMEAGDIKERLQRQNETQTKDEAKWNKNKTPHLRLRRRRGRVASEDKSNHPPFCFRRQLPSKQKEMSCYRFRQRDCPYLQLSSQWTTRSRFC